MKFPTLIILSFCLLLLPLWESVIVLRFVVRYFMSILVNLVAFVSLSSLCLVMVVWLLLAVPWVCLRFVIVVFPDHTHYCCWVVCFIFLQILIENYVSKQMRPGSGDAFRSF